MALSWEYRGRSIPGLPSTEEIIAMCPDKGPPHNCFPYPRNAKPIAFIKYGSIVPLAEVRTHLYVFDAFKRMQNHDSTVKVPEIYHAFEFGSWRYIVIEFIDGITAGSALKDASSPEEKDQICGQVAKAVTQLIRVPVPNGQRPGPIGGGLIKNVFFKDHEAPLEYDSVAHLQRNINAVLGTSGYQVNFSGERLCLCYSDISEGNFILTSTGDVWVIDFADASFLPISFMIFVIESRMRPFATLISGKVEDLPQPAHLTALNRATNRFHIYSDGCLRRHASMDVNNPKP